MRTRESPLYKVASKNLSSERKKELLQALQKERVHYKGRTGVEGLDLDVRDLLSAFVFSESLHGVEYWFGWYRLTR